MTQFRKSIATLLLGLVAGAALADTTLLNASYDVARDVYKDYNPMFQKHWKAKTGESLELKQSHGGSTKQVRAVADGLEADVVTMNQANDVDGYALDSIGEGLSVASWVMLWFPIQTFTMEVWQAILRRRRMAVVERVTVEVVAETGR